MYDIPGHVFFSLHRMMAPNELNKSIWPWDKSRAAEQERVKTRELGVQSIGRT